MTIWQVGYCCFNQQNSLLHTIYAPRNEPCKSRFNIWTIGQNIKQKTAIAAMHGPHSVFDILVTVRLYTVMAEACSWLSNEKQRKN